MAKPVFRPEDRFLLSGLLHHLPIDKLQQLAPVVRPDTIMRWHRHLLNGDTPGSMAGFRHYS
ncbi:hypothetical protein Aple_025090 [Acrocarpospora pleiomorpha]|uniref:Uncharacterized protein n=1 Tax=Acrocarpospora pleiomorpha TaxID=90975 RepID=A0A5M3XKF0_9ACTN|nr:hypothetical protein [Acrocarpospora pleiomorpha]GES19613.1 hypothetical protein Aple_025090 [Acrocarpospora pleiomorpha]